MKGDYLGSDVTTLLMSALQQTGEGIAIIDLSGTLLYLNHSFAHMHGYTEDELLGSNLSVFHLPSQMPSVEIANRQVLETGSFSGEIEHLHRSGRVFPTLMNSTLVRDETGKPIGMVGTLQDITDIKQRMEELRNARQMLESVLNAIPDIIGIQDAEHRIIRYNASGYGFLGLSPEEVHGRMCFEIIGHAEPCEKCATSICYNTRNPERLVKFIPEIGKWLDVRAYPILDESGEIAFVIEHLRDITRLKEAEVQARKLEEQLRVTQKLESLGVLAGGIAHDFNNILMAILGNADLALRETGLDGAVSEHLKGIRDAGRRAADLAGQMLDYSGRNVPSKAPVDLNRIIHETMNMLSVSVSRKTRIRYELSDELPMVLGDSTQLLQVIMNLVTNASDSLDNHPGTVTVATETRVFSRAELAGTYLNDDLPGGSYVVLTVTDTGMGMDQATMTRIFDPFFTTKFTGRGLGLAAALGVIRAHLGAVSVTSEPGLGSCFMVCLPVLDHEGEETTISFPAEAAAATGCILLVDDEDSVRNISGRMLEKLGYSVVCAADGREAVSLYMKNPGAFRSVIMDLTMPVMDGIDAFHRIIKIDPEAKVIISSGFSAESVMEQFGGDPIAGILHKPYSIDDVSLVLKKALATR